MKIAFAYGTMHRGGAERVIASLANTFCCWGDEVSIITADDAPSGYPLHTGIRHIHLNVAGASNNFAEAIYRNIRMFLRFRKEIQNGAFDAVVTFDLRYAVGLQVVFPIGRRFKLIASERANPNKLRLSRVEHLMRKLWLPKVDGFIFQTHRVSKCHGERLQQKGTVIHNGVFVGILPAQVTPFSERRHKDICAVGRLTWQKGYDVLLVAFQCFQQNHPDHHLHIYGEGDLHTQLEHQIIELGLEETVTLHGSVPDVMFHVADMGMYILSSRYEGMPNALMEAMACGLPCIAADCDFGPGELIENGVNGLLVPVEDATALATAMAKLADDSRLAKKISSNALNIRKTHSGEAIARQYHSYIERIAGKE